MRQKRDENGFALISAVMMLFIMTGLGLGVLELTNNQQKASSKEQASESAFNLAEGALNAQTGQLSRSWPSKEEPATQPTRCTEATTTSTNFCPSAESLAKGYPTATGTSCPAGASEPWGSPQTSRWTTYVRDNGPVGSPSSVYNSTAEQGLPPWDANGDGKVWVRAVGFVQCHEVTVLSLVSEQLVTTPFPEDAVAGNWFETSNEGNKVIVNTQGKSSHPGPVSMRCNGRTSENCKVYRPGPPTSQVEPDTTSAAPGPAHTLTAAQLEAVKSAARAANTYFASGTCPSSLKEMSGEPVYVEGPCELSANSGVGNSAAMPGFLVIQNGTFTLDSNAEFFGTVYAVNEQESNGVVVELHGKSKLTGSIIVDGNGGIKFGSSGGKGGEANENFVYDSSAVKNLKTFAGAAGTRNSFRVLPVNQ